MTSDQCGQTMGSGLSRAVLSSVGHGGADDEDDDIAEEEAAEDDHDTVLAVLVARRQFCVCTFASYSDG